MHDAMANLTEATLRRERARERVAGAEETLNHLAPNSPLRYGVAATARLRAAIAEAADAERAYEAAQDEPCPED